MKTYVSNISADTHERERLIGVILNDKRNTFTRELLETFDMYSLNGIVKMLDPPPAPQTNAMQRPVANYQGAQGAPQYSTPTRNAKHVEDLLIPPTAEDWCKKDAQPQQQEQSPVSNAHDEPPLPLPRRMI